jgi:DNA-binding response OmpR family regulator
VKALVVDDDRVLADLVALTLRKAGFGTVQAADGPAALRLWETELPDLVILDINLPYTAPRLDGLDVLKQIRLRGDTPVILLTVRGEDDDIVRGLQSGADDYMTKPFSPRQLTARALAVLRRAGKGGDPDAPTQVRVGGLSLDRSRRELHLPNGRSVQLTPLETRLLDVLMESPGKIHSFEDLIRSVWGPEAADRDMVRQLVRRLRLKIDLDPGAPSLIETLPGGGYGLRHPG